MNYKFRLTTTLALSQNIQKKGLEISRSRKRISKLNEKLKPNFNNLRKAVKDLRKLSVPKVRLIEKDPKVINANKQQQARVKEISALIRYDIINLLKEIDNIVLNLRQVIFDSDTILYRESRTLDKFYKIINKINDKNLAARVTNQISILKEEIKSTARRLYEQSKKPNILNKPWKKKKPIKISDKLTSLSTSLAESDKILNKLKITKIKEIVKNSEKQLHNVSKIEIAIVSLIPELKLHLKKIRNNLSFLESSAKGRIQEKLDDTEFKIDKTMNQITSNAERLLEDIFYC